MPFFLLFRVEFVYLVVTCIKGFSMIEFVFTVEISGVFIDVLRIAFTCVVFLVIVKLVSVINIIVLLNC